MAEEQQATEEQAPQEPKAHVYETLNDVPAPWRVLRGGKLNLDQVNWISARSHELGYWTEHDPNEPPFFMPDYGKARDELLEAHELVDGLWVPRKADA